MDTLQFAPAEQPPLAHLIMSRLGGETWKFASLKAAFATAILAGGQYMSLSKTDTDILVIPLHADEISIYRQLMLDIESGNSENVALALQTSPWLVQALGIKTQVERVRSYQVLQSPLHAAVLCVDPSARKSLVSIMLAGKASPLLPDSVGQSPLYYAQLRKDWVIAELCINTLRADGVDPYLFSQTDSETQGFVAEQLRPAREHAAPGPVPMEF